jgi:hypothetical protein
LRVFYAVAPFDVSNVAAVVRAAPRLRSFRMNGHVCGDDTLWLKAPTAPLRRAFVGLVHRRLRYFGVVIGDVDSPAHSPSRDDEHCASRLQRICFPRLRELVLIASTFFTTPDVT